MIYDYANYEGYKYGDGTELCDSQGRFLTQALFRETITKSSAKSGYQPIYTLKEKEVYGYPSAYQIYMHSVDEYDAAMKLVGSLRHWRKLCQLAWFLHENLEHGFSGLLQWREDMRARDESHMKAVLLDQAKKGSVSAASALYKDQQAPKKKAESSTNNNKGRPPSGKTQYDEDLERLQLIKDDKD